MSNKGNNMRSNSDQSQLEGKSFFEQFEEELFNSADSSNKIKFKDEKSPYYLNGLLVYSINFSDL